MPVKKIHGLCLSVGDTPDEESKKRALCEVAADTRWVRVYGTGDFPDHAHSLGLKTAVGVSLDDDLIANEQNLSRLIALAQRGHVDIAVVGNEVLFENERRKKGGEHAWCTPDMLIRYIARFRAAVPDVTVTTGEVEEFLIRNPEVMAACDIVAMHHYPFWCKIPIENAMDDFERRYRAVKALAGEKDVWVFETGWPSAGEPYGAAIPSLENAERYFTEFTAWAGTYGVKYFWFEAYDERWKIPGEGLHGGYWGMRPRISALRKY
jgi:exo-beta-1,3-glucanase (GH17 family)